MSVAGRLRLVHRHFAETDPCAQPEVVACFTVDDELRIVGWDPNAERFFGFRALHVLGARCSDVICFEPPGGPACVPHSRILEMAKHGELPATMTMRLLRADGLAVDVEVAIHAVLLDTRGKRVGYRHVARRAR